jgi:hypothetical protein
VKSNTYNKPDIKDLSYRLDERRDGYKIPIISEYMFNVMLNNESRKQFICYFISSLLGAKYDEVFNSIRFIKNKIVFRKSEDSNGEVDFVCRINKEVVGIEIGVCENSRDTENNIVFSTLKFGMGLSNKSTYNIDRLVLINLNNYSYYGNEKSINKCTMKDRDVYYGNDSLEFINIYLPVIREKCYNFGFLTRWEKTLLVFNETSDSVLSRICEKSIFKEYVICAKEASQSEISLAYDRVVCEEKEYLNEIKSSRDDGYFEGMEEGLFEAKKSIAKRLLSYGVSSNIVCKCTDYTHEELKFL